MPYCGTITTKDRHFLYGQVLLMALLFIVPEALGHLETFNKQHGLVTGGVGQLFNSLKMHFLHVSKAHFVGNVLIFIVLSYQLITLSPRFRIISVALFVVSGVMIYYFHTEKYRIVGASGWIFAIFTYTIIRTFLNIDFMLRIREILIEGNDEKFWMSMKDKILTAMFGTVIVYAWFEAFNAGIAPTMLPSVSFQSHKIGALVGPLVWAVEFVSVLGMYCHNKRSSATNS